MSLPFGSWCHGARRNATGKSCAQVNTSGLRLASSCARGDLHNMGIVTNYLVSLIAKQVESHRLVLWFDPEKHYEEVTAHLMIPQTTIVRFEGSFFALRHQVEPLINGLEPPRLVVYLPMLESETHHALTELEMLGSNMRPGHPSLSANTRL